MTPNDRPRAVAVRAATEEDLGRIVELFEHGALVEGKEDGGGAGAVPRRSD